MVLRVLGESASLDIWKRWLHLVKSCYWEMCFTSSDCHKKGPVPTKQIQVTQVVISHKKDFEVKECGLDVLRPNTTRQSSRVKVHNFALLDTLLDTPSNRTKLPNIQKISSVPKIAIKLLSKRRCEISTLNMDRFDVWFRTSFWQ